MEKTIGTDEIILLFDSYSSDSQYLHESIKRANYKCVPIVISENDFLPSGVFSIYDLLVGNFGKEIIGKPRFFNEIEVPDNWTISAGVNEKNGKITYRHEEKARIYYAEILEKYMVKEVEWFDRKGTTRFRDHYNRYGMICARTVYNAQGQPISKTWLSTEGREIIVENYVTGDIILNDGDIVRLFRTKVDLICYGLAKMGAKQNRIFFNSLSTPFFVSNGLGGSEKKDVLFWQESIGGGIPGNMQMILDGRAGRTSEIMVQKRSAYEKLIKLGVQKEMVHKLGFIYSFKRENHHNPEALICTRSDEIEHCQELIQAFPEVHFHIAAPTLMSSKLMNLEVHDNVSLYPAVKKQVLDELYEKCDYYFDINYHVEVSLALHQAFLNNLLIFAFQETAHGREYVADAHVYQTFEFERMVSDIKAVLENEDIMEQHLNWQHRDALAENKDAYVELLGV